MGNKENLDKCNVDVFLRAQVALKSPLMNIFFFNICDWINFRFDKPKEHIEYNVEIRTSEEKIKTLIEKIESRLNREYLEKVSEYSDCTFRDNESAEEAYYHLKRVFEKERDYLELKHERKDGSVVFFQLIASKWNVNNEDYSESLVESVEVSKTVKRKTLKKLNPHRQGEDPRAVLKSLLEVKAEQNTD